MSTRRSASVPARVHVAPCKLSYEDDDDWNGSTLAAYRRQYGEDPPCTCPEVKGSANKPRIEDAAVMLDAAICKIGRPDWLVAVAVQHETILVYVTSLKKAKPIVPSTWEGGYPVLMKKMGKPRPVWARGPGR